MVSYWDWLTILVYSGLVLITIIIAGLKTRIIKISEQEKSAKDGRSYLCNINYRITLASLAIAILPLLLLQALRDETIGGDLQRYLLTFQYTRYSLQSVGDFINNVVNQEPLYILTDVILGNITNWSDRAFIAFYTFVPAYFILKAIQREVKINGVIIPICYYVCFFYFRSFSMLRQSLAMAIILYAFTLIKEKRFKTYFFLTLLAFGFHYTAIIAIPIYFYAGSDKLSNIKKVLILFVFFALYLTGGDIISRLANELGPKYSDLASRQVDFGFGNFLIRLPMLAIILFYYKRLITYSPNIKIYANIFILNVVIAQFKYINPLFTRFALYAEMALIFILPTLYHVMKKELGNVVTNIIFILVFIGYFYYTLYDYTYLNPYYIMPYKLF